MGYTVYYSQKRPFTMQEWGDIRASAINMFNRLKQVKGGSGTGRPIIDNTDIIFNGDAAKEEDHETFQLSKNGNGFQFCKTARKPYDRFVKAMLVVANYYAPGALEVTCDGDDEPDCWTQGVATAQIYAKGVPGRSPCSPLELKEPFKNGNLLDGKSPSQWIQDKTKGDNDIDDAVVLWLKLTEGNKVHSFLANYLKANIDDIKDAYTPA
jgi:hypothetical protein